MHFENRLICRLKGFKVAGCQNIQNDSTLGGFKPRPPKGQTVGDLLSSIPRDDVSSLLPKGFNNKKPPRTFNRPSTSISSIKQDDVSKFLPPGFKFEESTTTTTTDTSLIDDILSSIGKPNFQFKIWEPQNFTTSWKFSHLVRPS